MKIVKIAASLFIVVALMAQTVTYNPLRPPLVLIPAGGSGSGNVVLTSGSGDPSAACTPPSASNLAIYYDTNGLALWYCSETNIWKKIIDTTNVGAFTITGLTGSAPATPDAGYVACWMDSSDKLFECKDDTGAITKVGRVTAANVDVSADVTTGNASTSSHGFLKKLSNTATEFMNGQGNWAVPATTITAGAGIGISGSTISRRYVELSSPGWVEEFWGTPKIDQTAFGGVMPHVRINTTGTSTWTLSDTPAVNPEKHPGVVRIVFPATANPVATLVPWDGSRIPFAPGLVDSDWAHIFYISDAANTRLNVGWTVYSSGFNSTTGVYLRSDPGAGDTTFRAFVGNGSTAFANFSAPTAGWHTVLIQYRASGVGGNQTVYFTLDGVQKTFCSSGCDAALNKPTSNQMTPVLFYGFNGTPSAGTACSVQACVEVDAVAGQFYPADRN